jgi:predicted lysophospholipase L1 biosynthesis ABC-type transport system permease subunit
MTGFQATATFQAVAEGASAPEGSRLAYNIVGPGYFRTMGTQIVAGHEFEKNDRKNDVCVLNQAAAAYLFEQRPAVGQYLRTADPKEFPETVSCRVIGVSEDAKFASLREPAPRTIYYPLSTKTLNDAGNLVFLMNSATKAQAIAGCRKAVTEIAPSIPLVLFATLKDQMDAALGSQRLITTMSNLFAGLALFLSALGLYGLLSSSVAQRTGEIGVRIALGAQRSTILRMILSEAFGLLAAGVLLGAVALLFAVRFVQNLLFGVSSFDPITLMVSLVLLITVAFFAAVLPALRAACLDPMQALRSE